MTNPSEILERLKAAAQSDEVISPLVPQALAGGRWWREAWPSRLCAGILEPRRGYRFRPENLALAAIWPFDGLAVTRILDLGCGTGSLLLLAHELAVMRGAEQAALSVRLCGVDVQQPMLQRLARSLEAHRLEAKLVLGDLRESTVRQRVVESLGGLAQLIVANPPFFPASWGRPSAELSTHTSTHALHGDVSDFANAAAALLAEGGRAYFVFDAQRLAQLMVVTGRAGLRVLRWLFLPDTRPGHESEAFRVWVELAHGDGVAEL